MTVSLEATHPRFALAGIIVVVAAGLVVWHGTVEGRSPMPEKRDDPPGVHNLFRVLPRVYSGSQPEGAEGFQSLAKLGVKFIVSVDGAAPDVAAATAAGLAYVHLPIGYDGVPRERAVELARVLQGGDVVYVHCHHGKHRGPAAVAAALRCLDPHFSADDAEQFLKRAGTDPHYAGLYRDVRESNPLSEAESRVTIAFVDRMPVRSLVERMVAIDGTWERIKQCEKAGWNAPSAHPDVSPAHEALQLVEHYREVGRLPTKPVGEFGSYLVRAEAAAVELEASLRTNAGPAAIDAAFKRSASLCSQCHAATRDGSPSK